MSKERETTTLYAVRENFNGELDMCSVKVERWGKGWKALGGGAGLAFECRSLFDLNEYPRTEADAWRQFIRNRNELIRCMEGRIDRYKVQIVRANKKLHGI